MTHEEMARNWNLNADVLRSWGIDPEMLGKMLKVESGGYGKLVGLNPRSSRPFQIAYKRNGQNRIMSTDRTYFVNHYCK